MRIKHFLRTLVVVGCSSVSQLLAGGLPGTVIGSSGSWNGNTISKAFDSNLSTYYDAINASGDWAGLDLGSGKVIKGIRYCPRPGFGYRMVGGQFQGANVANFSSGVVTLYTIMSAPPEGGFTTQALTNTTAFRYVRYIGPANGYCNVAEAEFYDANTPMPVVLFSDFPVPWGYAIWANAGTYNVNESYNNALRWAWPAGFLMSQRQSGVFRQTLYTEAAATAAGGAYDNLTQLNNTNLPNTLLLSTDPAHGQGFTWVSPNQDFSAFSAQGVKANDIQVQIAPLGPGSAGSSGHWAALVFGAAPGSVVTNRGTGVLIRNGGGYKVFDGGNSVFSGNAGSNQFYKIEFQINSTNGAYTLLINGNTIYSGTHEGGYFASNYITLEGYNIPSDAGIQNDYFQSLQVWGTQPVAAANTSYYLSPTGNDTNSGASSSAPWQTLARANVEQFRPGDQILLQGGQTFNGCLNINNSGAPGSPLTISAYGTGNAAINGGGISAISVYDAHDVAISNLTLVGNGYASNQGDGITIINDTGSTPLATFNLNNVEASNFGHKGICFLGGINNITVAQSSFHDNGEGGLWVQGGGNNANYSGCANVVVDHVNASHNPGAAGDGWSGCGISVASTTGVVVNRCVAGNNGWLSGMGGAMSGIQVSSCDHVLVQYSESYNSFAGQGDGEGICFEQVTHGVMQYNYTHSNEGAGFMILGDGVDLSCHDDIIRYNVTQKDAQKGGYTYGGVFVGGGAMTNIEVYNNTSFVSPSTHDPSGTFPMSFRILGLTGSGNFMRNNIAIATGGREVLDFNGNSDDTTNNLSIQGNDYWADSGTPFGIQWNGYSFGAFQAATGQELLNGNNVALEDNPGLNNAGGGGTIGNADQLATLTAYQLRSTSPLVSAGLDLSQFGTVWDPCNFAADPFLGQYFSTNRFDFYDNPLPANGSGQFSVGAHQVNLALLPPAPTGLSVSANLSAVELSWDVSSGATGYSVWRSTIPGGPYAIITNINTTTYTDASVANGMTYYYVVTAANTAGDSVNSAQASTTWLVLPSSGVTAQGGANTLTFPTAPGVSYQVVYKDSLTDALWQVLLPGFFTATGTTVTLTDADSTSPDSRFYRLQVATDCQTGLPAPWSSGLEGLVGIPGNTTFSNNTYTVSGSGADIGGTNDAFQFASQPVSGDCAIIAQVASEQNIDPWSKAGVMIRQNLNPGAPDAVVTVTPGHGVSFQYRTTQNGNSTTTTPRTCSAPYWVKVTRIGSTFTGFSSPNGVNWTQEGSVTIAMPSTVYAGLAVSSHNNASLCAATFASVGLMGPSTTADIGAVGRAGSMSFSNGVYSVSGSGADIWDTSDQFRYVFEPASGDCDIVAKVLSVQNTDPWAKAGVMIRESLSANAQFADMLITPGNGANFQYRNGTGGSCGTVQRGGITAPYWVRVNRTGNSFQGYISTDGTAWTQVGTPQTIAMDASVYLGLCVTAHNNSALCTATFTNVVVLP